MYMVFYARLPQRGASLAKEASCVFSIRIAELVVRIDNKYDYVRELCKDYIVSDELPADMTVSVSQEDILKEMRGSGIDTDAEIDFPEAHWKGYPESLCIYRCIVHEMLRFHGFLMHAAVVSVDGNAYAFCAKSGTGKTTHMKLWLDKFGERAQVVNGDKPILRYIDGTLYAFGTPWCGSEGMGANIKAPLKAIGFIERSETNSITRMTPSAVLGRIFHQLLMPQDEESLDRFMNMIEKMIDTTPCYLLRCNMDPIAADVAWQGIQEDKQ